MIDRPTARRSDPLPGLALSQERLHRRRQAHARRRRSLRGAVRAVQRAQRPASDRPAADGERRHRCARCRTASPTSSSSSSPASAARSRRASPSSAPRARRRSSSYTLIVADADGENQQKIASSTEPIMSPAWSPDGQSLAYVSFESKASAIYVQTLRTGERRRVSARAGINGAPAWSPDGGTLALTLSRKDGDVDIYTLKLVEPVADAHDVRPGHRHRAGLVRGRPQALLHVRSRRRAADLRDRRRRSRIAPHA